MSAPAGRSHERIALRPGGAENLHSVLKDAFEAAELLGPRGDAISHTGPLSGRSEEEDANGSAVHH
jgi:hypothetical protein